MAPLQRELSGLEVEPLEIVVNAPGREGFYTPPQDSRLYTLTIAPSDLEAAALLTGTLPTDDSCCCCCCPMCCC
jgi:hypothetical protein